MAAMPLLCIIQGTACLWLQGENLLQDKSALPTAPSPLPERCRFGCWLCASGAAGPTLWDENIPGLCQPSLACRARRTVTGIKQGQGWVEGLIYYSINLFITAEPARVMSMSHSLLGEPAEYLVSGFCSNTFLFIRRLAFDTNLCCRSAQINEIQTGSGCRRPRSQICIRQGRKFELHLSHPS